mmetsp:Transcript_31591/g.75437  ORF Transcript_31591/g.75437 Transcript_31591/m.75437 type:complete len:406 (+) Transcript_31591:179-1396(+)
MEDEQSTEAAAEGGGEEDPKPDTDDEKEEADDHDQQLRKGGPEADLGYHPGGSKKKSPRRTDHTYRDFSKYPADHIPTDRRTQNNFPAKLHQILSTPAYSHIISWMPHGRAWKVHNKDLLVTQVFPYFFNQTKYVSFTRQLNGWGFKRLHQSGNDYNAIYHECFLRGLPHLTNLMKRVEGNLGKLVPYIEGEPNFYEISKNCPLPIEGPRPPPPPRRGSLPSHMQATYVQPSSVVDQNLVDEKSKALPQQEMQHAMSAAAMPSPHPGYAQMYGHYPPPPPGYPYAPPPGYYGYPPHPGPPQQSGSEAKRDVKLEDPGINPEPLYDSHPSAYGSSPRHMPHYPPPPPPGYYPQHPYAGYGYPQQYAYGDSYHNPPPESAESRQAPRTNSSGQASDPSPSRIDKKLQ